MSNIISLTGKLGEDLNNQLTQNPWPLLQTIARQRRILQAEVRGIEYDAVTGEECFVVFLGYAKGLIPLSQSGVEGEIQRFALFGVPVPFIVEKVEKDKEVVYLSVKKAKERLAAETLKSIKVNSIVTGTVQKITRTRAYVDIGGVEAILMKPEISHNFLQHPGDAIRLGDQFQVKITEIDQDGLVYVSKKALEQDPWIVRTQQLKLQQPYLAEVTGQTPEGLFLKLMDGVSAMANWNTTPVKIGTRVIVKVRKIDTIRRRINCKVVSILDK